MRLTCQRVNLLRYKAHQFDNRLLREYPLPDSLDDEVLHL